MNAKDEAQPKKQHRSTMFAGLFSVPEYFLQLLRECRNNAVGLTVDEIKEFSIDSAYVRRQIKNDVSFITSDNRLIILVEHQSTICRNIALRLLFYYTELLQMWIRITGLDVFGATRIASVPVPEFYVVYNGKQKLTETKQTFTIKGPSADIKVEVEIIDIRYENLQTKHDKTSILTGYSYFYKEFDERVNRGMHRKEAFEQARQLCVQNGYLKGIIEKGRFIMDYKSYLFDHAEQLKAEGREEGREKGREEIVRMLMGMTGSGLTLEEALAVINCQTKKAS